MAKHWQTLMAIFRAWLALCLLALAAAAQAFPTNQCAANRFGDDLNCTANDVQITGMRVIGDTTACIGGDTITLDLEATINFGSPSRYDVGIFMANDGKSPQNLAANGGAGTCYVSVLPTASPFLDLDGPTDTCGDGNGSIGGGTGSGIHYLTNVPVKCQALPGSNGNLYIPFVVSWDNQASPSGDMCQSNADPFPNTKSKCNSPTIAQGTIAVVVLPRITITDGKTFVSSGSATNYTVTVTNNTGAALAGILFKVPPVAGIAANTLSCSQSGGATCPTGATVAALQGAGITLPSMPANGQLVFTINATLAGNPGDSLAYTASVATAGQSNTATDVDVIANTIALLPVSQAKSGAAGGTVSYNYTVYNLGPTTDTISLAVTSSQGWSVTRSPAAVTLASGATASVTVSVPIPSGAALGAVDTTTLTATSGVNPTKTASAQAVTTVTQVLDLSPSNTGSSRPNTSIFYTHRLQNNDPARTSVTLTPSVPAGCTGWTAALFRSDKTTALASPVTVAANGGILDFTLKVSVPSNAPLNSSCTVTLTAQYASGTANSVSVIDKTNVKYLLLFEDPGYTTEQYTYPTGNNVYGMSFGLTNGTPYYYKWISPTGSVVRTSPTISNLVSLPDTYPIPNAGPNGTWTVQLWNAATNSIFDSTTFYVGPDHLSASAATSSAATGAGVTVNLALHGRDHSVPLDASGNLVQGAVSFNDPLQVTVKVNGSATITGTTLSPATITGQTVTGRLGSATGTATITISDPVAEAVTVTPATVNGALYGSPLRDHGDTVTFATSSAGLDHIRFEHEGSGITCQPSTITIKACANSSCSALSSASATVVLSTPANGTWSANPVTFVGSTTVTLSSSVAQTVRLDTTGVTPTPVPAAPGTTPQCYVGTTANCNLAFASSGLFFSTSATGTEATIPTQISGVSSGTYYVRAVTRGSTGQCTSAVGSGSATVSFAYECSDPAACSGANLMTVNGGSGSTVISRNNGGTASLSYTPVTLSFNASGSAPFTFNFSDAGKVILYARQTVSTTTLVGNSNPFVVKPYSLVLTDIKQTAAPNTANPGAADATGARFVAAGEAFSAKVTAVNATCSATLGTYTLSSQIPSDCVTPNYGSENAEESAKIISALVAGLGLTENPPLTNGSSVGEFSGGSASRSDLSWGEVGIITLTPQIRDDDYLGTGPLAPTPADGTVTTSVRVGRFYPHHFGAAGSVVTRSDRQGTEGQAKPFTYMGEPMKVGLTVTALSAGETTTQNYIGSFAKLGVSALGTGASWFNVGCTGTAQCMGLGAVAGGTALSPRLGIDTTAAYGSAAPTGTWTAGVGSFTANLVFSRLSSPDGPYAPLSIGVLPRDSDGVTLAPADIDLDADGNGSAERQKIFDTDVRYGRLWLTNAFGNQFIDLPVPIETQYWTSSGWRRNPDDSLSALVRPTQANGGLTNALAGNTSAAMGGSTGSPVNVFQGSARFLLAKPLIAGMVDIWSHVLLGLASQSVIHPWLPANTPSVRACFGLCGPRSSVIYIRERF